MPQITTQSTAGYRPHHRSHDYASGCQTNGDVSDARGWFLNARQADNAADLEKLQRNSLAYFIHEADPAIGLIVDKSAPNWPASIPDTGLALAAYPVGVERGFWPRSAATWRPVGGRGTANFRLLTVRTYSQVL